MLSVLRIGNLQALGHLTSLLFVFLCCHVLLLYILQLLCYSFKAYKEYNVDLLEVLSFDATSVESSQLPYSHCLNFLCGYS